MPPAVSHDRTHTGGGQLLGLERVLDFDQSDGSGEDDYNYETGTSQLFDLPNTSAPTQPPYSAVLDAFNTPPYSEKAFNQTELGYDEVLSIPLQMPDTSYNAQETYHSPQDASFPTNTGTVWRSDQVNGTDLSNLMGGLGIANDGVGAYRTPTES